MNSWLEERGLDLATEKNRDYISCRRRIATMNKLQFGGKAILTTTTTTKMNYLGVKLHTKLKYGEQIRPLRTKLKINYIAQ